MNGRQEEAKRQDEFSAGSSRQFAFLLERLLRRKKTKEHGGKKQITGSAQVASYLNKTAMREQGQDTVKRTESWPG